MSTRTVLHEADIARALTRISHEILESNKGPDGLILLGIPTRGVTLAHRIARLVEQFGGAPVPSGALDVTMYRDDLHRNPTRAPQRTEIPPGGIDGKVVVLVDDVLFSGRSIRAALDALQDIGRPSAVRLAALIDRGHRELPIRPDFVGKNLPSARDERVRVRLTETDGEEFVSIEDEGTRAS
ncbi:MAG TPA: bifunctional pyr operon transcriptional regulator/uracil phosphoribosyltransferase PyrR [Microbacterium sp.]|nr:bifunctional pyr operon transcriptional regulator/uracil phosphoribosyltransferase PyrR [Microbacterium sp.]